MEEKKRQFYLILIMTSISLFVGGISIWILYQTALKEEKVRLAETVKSQARLIEAMARFDAAYSKYDHPEGAAAATISQIIDAHNHYEGFGTTGEFTLAKRDGDKIIFLLRHRHGKLNKPEPATFQSELAEPMQMALSG